MKRIIYFALAIMFMPGLVFAQQRDYDNTPIDNLDLGRYLGMWYEIARFDHRFERDMENVTAEYLLRDDGKIDVINSGWRNGRLKVANGKARQTEPVSDPAHLEVSFFGPFYNDYNILMVDKNYKVALVGSKSPNYLWILSRTPRLSDQILNVILDEAQSRGYDTGKLIWVHQSLKR